MTDGADRAAPNSTAHVVAHTLRALVETVILLRSQLAELAGESASEGNRPTSLAELACEEIHNRALRARFFDSRLFCDPAWDMLLDLYFQEARHRQVSVSSLCIASCAPGTTALRWIGALENAGLVERLKDPKDKRRVFVRLTAVGKARITAYLAAMVRQGWASGGNLGGEGPHAQ